MRANAKDEAAALAYSADTEAAALLSDARAKAKGLTDGAQALVNQASSASGEASRAKAAAELQVRKRGMPSPPYLPLGHVACLPQPSCLRATCQVSRLQGQEGAAQAEYDKTFVLNFGKKVCHMAVDPVLSLFTSP